MPELMSSPKIIAGATYLAKDFQNENPDDCELHFLLAPSQAAYMISNAASKIIFLQPFQFTVSSDTGLNVALQTVTEHDIIIKKKFRNTRIGIYAPDYTLIPESLYDDSAKKDYMNFSFVKKDGNLLMTDLILNGSIRVLYSIPNEVVVSLANCFSGKEIRHTTSSLLEHLMKQKAETDHAVVYAYVMPGIFQLIIIHNRALLFCNSFSYQSSEDFVFHLLFCSQQLHLDPELFQLKLLGEIVRDSSLFQLLYKYIRNIEFISAHPSFTFDDDYTLPGNFYFNLFCI